MGNLGSQINSHKYKLDSPTGVYHHHQHQQQQQLSLPRINPGHHLNHHQPQKQQKVLPVDQEPRPKLRSTENGKILHSGGTLSGRHQEGVGGRVSRGTFLNAREKVNLVKESQLNDTHLKKFGSEPDLRHRLRQEAAKRRQDGRSSNERRVGLFKSRNDLGGRRIERKQVEVSYLQEADATKKEREQIGENEETSMRKYYFGMEEHKKTNSLDDGLNYEIESYVFKSSDLSDELLSNLSQGLEDGATGDGDPSQQITLNLRPILPKKRLEIPRFSSSLAWKLLYSVGAADSDLERDGSGLNVTETSEERFSVEENIAPFAAGRLAKSLDFQFSQDKSGDSGISGDETPKPAAVPWGHHYESKQSWTPQQDLGDEDSSADDAEDRQFNSVPYCGGGSGVDRPHIFSLSLPRDHFTNQCALEKYKNHLKRSVSGIFSTAADSAEVAPKNSNWLLSKSAPNSLNNASVCLDNGGVGGAASSSQPPLLSRRGGKGRIMYLPIGGDALSEGHRDEELIAPRKDMGVLEEADRREQRRLKEMEAMQRIEEEFRRKRSRYNGLYSNNHQQDFRKTLISAGEKSV